MNLHESLIDQYLSVLLHSFFHFLSLDTTALVSLSVVTDVCATSVTNRKINTADFIKMHALFFKTVRLSPQSLSS